MLWRRGPMPHDTWFWGGVVVRSNLVPDGFHFADFQGDHVILIPGGERIKAEDILWYNNLLHLPPCLGINKRSESDQ